MSRTPEPPGLFDHLRRLGAAFWIMIGFGVFAAVAGLLLARLGPQLFPVRAPEPGSAVHAASTKPSERY